MRVALLVEGQGEFKSLPLLARALEQRCGIQLLRPTLLHVDPLAPPGVIAGEIRSVDSQITRLRADVAVLLLDRENSPTCPGERARQLENAVAKLGGVRPALRVVLKDRAFENWLIADLEALRAQPARFKITQGLARRIEPGKADTVNAHPLLSGAATGRSYHKIDDAMAICRRIDPERAARHSRSFRHFLHVLGDPTYANGCRRPL